MEKQERKIVYLGHLTRFLNALPYPQKGHWGREKIKLNLFRHTAI